MTSRMWLDVDVIVDGHFITTVECCAYSQADSPDIEHVYLIGDHGAELPLIKTAPQSADPTRWTLAQLAWARADSAEARERMAQTFNEEHAFEIEPEYTPIRIGAIAPGIAA